jgi:inner membrane protein
MNELINHFSEHHDHLLYAIAGACLLLEMGVLGMSGPLLFLAVGCAATGILVTLNILNGWEYELLSVGILTSLATTLLWGPLKKFQNAGGGPDTSSDMIGKILPVTLEITRDQGRVAYSGIEWQARLDSATHASITPGHRAIVTAVDGSLLLVKPE